MSEVYAVIVESKLDWEGSFKTDDHDYYERDLVAICDNEWLAKEIIRKLSDKQYHYLKEMAMMDTKLIDDNDGQLIRIVEYFLSSGNRRAWKEYTYGMKKYEVNQFEEDVCTK